MATLSNTRVNSRKEKLVEGLHAKWETSAPLTDFQSDQIVDLAALVSEALSPPSNDNDPHTSTSLDKNNSIGRDSIHSITELSSNNSGNTGANSYTMAQSERDSIDSLSGGGLGIARSRSIASSGEGDVVDTNLDPVVHTHHFYAWFANVESAMDVEQESMYR
ncbi:hypothetical protein SARC_08440 [Sphaeroforma arctica JP610]|uniref:Uncharacterized protein n=1 Tax=Sphaeroforma arctica JP610 TaxID=667725 RepID=A0A0L0FQW8_9EUKA|nr:hypothetical protein SARC_08440 [Sphaeroforma arctica JP610]KNC79160.1 hypothetical protein SARC_08440 [Sphaeroforma arctica JP610]|eukprot:XP_014153062.1 hypothetical protein SARC_08440 [Sphaeroforma arctica JP610]